MAEERVGILTALWRWVTFYNWRKGRSILRSANSQFTSSADGIEDAFDIHKDQLVVQYKALLGAASKVETVIQGWQQELKTLDAEEKEVDVKIAGALSKAEAATNPDDRGRHKAAWTRFKTRKAEIDARQAELLGLIESERQGIAGHERQLTELQARIQRLPAEKAQEVAKFVSNKALLEMRQQLQGLTTAIDTGPIDAVRQRNRELQAEVNVTRRLDKTDVNTQDNEYADAGKVADADDEFELALKAKKAEREAKTGGGAQTENKTTEGRPQI